MAQKGSAIDPKSRGLRAVYMTAGVAALVAAIVFRRWLAAEYSLLRSLGFFPGGPVAEPSDALGWFLLLQRDRITGLVLLNALDLVNYALVALMFVGVYGALRESRRGAMTLAIGLTALAVGLYFASNQAFPLLALSGQYAAATSEPQRQVLLSAGQALLTMSSPTIFGSGVFWAFTSMSTAGLVIAAVMWRSGRFGRVTAVLGVCANALGLGYFVTVPFAPSLTYVPLSASAPLLLAWYVLVGIRLVRLSGAEEE